MEGSSDKEHPQYPRKLNTEPLEVGQDAYQREGSPSIGPRVTDPGLNLMKQLHDSVQSQLDNNFQATQRIPSRRGSFSTIEPYSPGGFQKLHSSERNLLGVEEIKGEGHSDSSQMPHAIDEESKEHYGENSFSERARSKRFQESDVKNDLQEEEEEGELEEEKNQILKDPVQRPKEPEYPRDHPLFKNFYVHKKWKRFAFKSLYVLEEKNKCRFGLIWFVEWRWFQFFITALIIVNSLLLGIYDYMNPDSNSLRNRIVNKSELIFTIIFTIECTLKIIAFGFITEPGCYLRDAWNWLDFIVVVTSLLQFVIPANVTVLRTFRLFRPLRSLSSVPSMRLLVSTLISSLWQLGSILALALFFFTVFAILGVSLWQGQQHYICRTSPEPENGQWLPLEPADRLCGGTYKCPAGSYCGSIIEAYDSKQYKINSDIDLYADSSTQDFLYGFTTFDNFPRAFLTIFQCVTLEGWTTVMYFIGDAYNIYISAMYFVFCIIICSYFLLNLTVAVMLENFSSLNRNEEAYNKKIQKILKTTRLTFHANIFIRMMAGSLAVKQALKEEKTLRESILVKSDKQVKPEQKSIAQKQYSSSGNLGRVEEDEAQEMKSVSDEQNSPDKIKEISEAERLSISRNKVGNHDTERAKGEIESAKNTEEDEQGEKQNLQRVKSSTSLIDYKPTSACYTFFFGKPELTRAPHNSKYYKCCFT